MCMYYTQSFTALTYNSLPTLPIFTERRREIEGKNKKKGDRQIARWAYRPLAPGKRKQGRPEAT